MGDVTLNQALEAALRVAKHDHLVVLITDLDGADDETQRLATQISAHNDVLIVAVYDPLGISLKGMPGMLAHDGGRLWEIPANATFARDFQEAFQRRLDRWREIFRTIRVPVLPISTAGPVVDQIRALFGSRPSKS